jgi:hypothetical protein
MARSYDVLEMLCEGVEYICRGLTYEDIDWLGNEPAITKEQFAAGFGEYDVWKAQQDAAKATERQAVLDRLGITAHEAALLLS